MERRLAFAWSSAVVGVAVSGAIAVAAVTGSPFLGFDPDGVATGDRATPPTTAGAGRDEYVIIHRPGSPPTREESRAAGTPGPDAATSRGGGTSAGAPATSIPASRAATVNPSGPIITPAPPPTSPPTTTARPPTTVSPPTTTPAQVVYVRDLPAGWEVPSGWPPDKPLPSIPPGCASGHLEDNLTWNCQH